MFKKYKKIIYCLVLLLFFILLVYGVKNYFKPLFIILFLMYTCTPIYNFLSKHKIFNSKINAIISILIINILLIIIIFVIGNFIFNQINIFLSTGYKGLIQALLVLVNKISVTSKLDVTEISDKINKIYTMLINSDFFKKGAVYTTDGIFTYFIGNIATYFILVDRYVIFNAIEKFMSKDNIAMVKNKFKDIDKMIKIEIILVCVTTLETILGFYALGIKNGFILGVICGILDIVPYIGTIVVFLPIIVYEFYTKQYIIAFGLISLYLLLFINRQIMEAKFLSNKLKIHPLPMILSAYVGIKIFGIVGLFVGPIYVVSVNEIMSS